MTKLKSNMMMSVAIVAGGIVLAAAPAYAEAVVNIWHTEPNAKTKAAMDEIIKDFEAQNPGVRIVQEAVGWGDLEKKMQAALASGAFPEAAHGQTYVARSLSDKGLLRPLNDVVESIGEDNIFDVVKKLDYNEKDGNYYGLSHAVGTDLMIYRKDMFRDAGITEPAKNWDEWVEQLTKLTKDTNGDGTPDQYGISLAGPGFFINEDLYMLVGSNGGRLFAENGRPTFTEKPVIETLELWQKLGKCCLPKDWLSRSYLDTFADLATGKAAVVMGYGRGTEYFEQYSPEPVAKGDIGVQDSKPVGPSGSKYLTQLDAEPWMIFKDSKHPEEAAAFLKFFYNPQNYIKYIKSVPVHFFPITKTVREMPEYKAIPEFQKWKFWIDAQHKVIENDEPKPVMITEWDDLQLPFISEIAGSTILVDMVTDAVVNGKTAEEAAARAQERAETLIEQLGYKTW